ncbi:hypothetical protein NTG1052_50064 [Candidatus Nitrotoga sp. 1052]|nr:hypothetical protein NTG1052_50064 [Candidatus Nitrotoga sp. 1052]
MFLKIWHHWIRIFYKKQCERSLYQNLKKHLGFGIFLHFMSVSELKIMQRSVILITLIFIKEVKS